MEENQLGLVLVVSHEANDRKDLTQWIQDSFTDCRVMEAPDAREGNSRLSNEKFDLAVIDAQLPRANAVRLLESISLLSSVQQPKFVTMLGALSDFEIPPNSPAKQINSALSLLPKPITQEALKQHIQQILSPAAKPVTLKPQIDVSFINPFIEAAVLVLKQTANTVATKEKIYVRTQDMISGDISAVIAMNSKEYLGSMAIAFEERTFLAMVESMLGEKYTAITPEIHDAASEICNQVFGVAKAAMNQIGHSIEQAIPSVIFGKAHAIQHLAEGTCLVVQFKTPAGRFSIEAVVSPRV